ncbi:MAG: hypothetical protein R6V20_09730 [Desulfobia sp.]
MILPIGQYMEHEQVEEIFPRNGPGPVLPGFGMEIPEGDHTVFTAEDVLLRTVSGDLQALVGDGLQELCPEDFCQGLMAEEKAWRFRTPPSCFHVDARPRHDDMDVRVIVKCP